MNKQETDVSQNQKCTYEHENSCSKTAVTRASPETHKKTLWITIWGLILNLFEVRPGSQLHLNL